MTAPTRTTVRGRRVRGRRPARAPHPPHPHASSWPPPSPRATTRTSITIPAWPSSAGSPDIFMNILSTNGFVGRYVTDWTGPGRRHREGGHPPGRAQLPGRHHGLHRPVTSVTAAEVPGGRTDGRGVVEIAVRGANCRGDHVTGTVRVALPVTTDQTHPHRTPAVSARTPPPPRLRRHHRHQRHRGDGILQGLGPQRAAPGHRGGGRRPRRRRPAPRPTSTGW